MKVFQKSVLMIIMSIFASSLAFAKQPKYVFYFIGDGLGASQRQFAEFFLQEKTSNPGQKLLMNTFDVAGMNTTYAANTLITDSAAAGTALASGVKTNKGVIGMNPRGVAVKTLTECAEDEGLATGLITTTRLTHATPAAFAAHNITRNNENEIAVDFLKSGVDFFAGGGVRHFLPKGTMQKNADAIGNNIKSKRKDNRNLVKEFGNRGYKTFVGMKGAKAFNKTDFSSISKVFAAFTYTHMPYEIERINQYHNVPSLASMTRAAIEVLSKDNDGFFLMIEGGRIDHAAHANDPTGVIYDTIAFDKAVKEAYSFLKAHKDETLIVVVGDHETGGMGLGMDSKGYKLDMASLMKTRISVEDTLSYGSGQYKGNRSKYLRLLKNQFGLSNLNQQESKKLNQAMSDADSGKTMGYYKVNPASLTAAHILSSRANIHWTTTIHTATMIPMSATGIGAARFSGYKDNTEIAQAMAVLMGFDM